MSDKSWPGGGEAETRTEVISAACACCGLTEDCTPEYVESVRERFGGRWVCGLCGEAVEDEIGRAGRWISTEEALSRHMSFSESFRAAGPPVDTAEPMIAAMRQLLRRSLDSPRATPSSPRRDVEEGGGTPSRRSLARQSSYLSTAARHELDLEIINGIASIIEDRQDGKTLPIKFVVAKALPIPKLMAYLEFNLARVRDRARDEVAHFAFPASSSPLKWCTIASLNLEEACIAGLQMLRAARLAAELAIHVNVKIN
ncbi:hypothetical protein ZIOFF_010474 [Zingiber officinale]|uniref:Uncharacterized protein n=1 Tax=Zingiber officinale TaxID=94328 RepID=A0A8J5I4D1_ZINOF|nr:hypothetical protein ZIOFF_010474 [Zingiber officinale]